ncbi:MAG: lysylphosphatidylglycerol synthase transmembrane domain-containing protein [Bacteroidia bacterium]
MNKKLKSTLQYTVLFGLVIVLLWWMLRGMADKKEEIIRSFQQANYFWVGISVIVAGISHFIRAYRWKYLLEPLGYHPRTKNSLAAVLVGYLVNYIIPRAGELSRCTAITKYEKVPFQVALGTVITERIVDFALLILVFLLTLLFQFKELIGLTDKYILTPMQEKFAKLGDHPALMVLLLVSIAGAVIGFFLFRKKIRSMLTGKFGNLIKGFADGISSIRKMKNPGAFILQSVLIWAMYFFALYFCFFALKETSQLGLKECLTILLFGTFGVIFTPGGLGAYHLIVMNILFYYGINETTGFAFAWLAWGSQFIFILIAGPISLIALPLMNKKTNEPA